MTYTSSLSPGDGAACSRWGSASRDADGTFNFAGVADPAIDAMIDASADGAQPGGFRDGGAGLRPRCCSAAPMSCRSISSPTSGSRAGPVSNIPTRRLYTAISCRPGGARRQDRAKGRRDGRTRNDLDRRRFRRRLPVVLHRPEAAGYGDRRSAGEVDVEVHWRPFQLDPTIPPEGKDRKRYMMDKFGSEERIRPRPMSASKRSAKRSASTSPSTRSRSRPTRSTRIASSAGRATAGEAVQNRLTQRLFKLYFEEGANIGDHAVLIEAARESGMDAALVETLLATDADADAVRGEIATAQRMGVTGVPCFLLEGKYAVMGAQESERHRRRHPPGRRSQGARRAGEPDRSTGRLSRRLHRQPRQLRHHHGRAVQPLLRRSASRG